MPEKKSVMRRLLPLLAVLSLAFAPLPRPSAVKEDLARLQGAWVLMYSVKNRLREDQSQQAVWLFEGSRVTATLDGKPGSTFDVVLHGKASPRSFDVLTTEKGKPVVLGRYAVDGDTLWVSLGDPRPADLSGDGTSNGVWVFHRKKR
jgi:uncharacterized protein (TIGR03067 family)